MAKPNISKRISALLLFVLLCLFVLQLAQSALGFTLSNPIKIIIYLVIYFIPIFIYSKLYRYKTGQLLRLRHVKIKYMPFIILFALSTSILCALINAGSFYIFENVFHITARSESAIFSSSNPLVIFITMIALPALAEELLLRGAALTEYSKYGVAVSVLMTSLLFAFFHGNAQIFLSLVVAGVFYAVLTHLFQSVYPAIIAHMANNLISVYISRNSGFVQYILGDTLFTIIAAVVICLILFFTLQMLERVVDSLGDKRRLKTNPRKLVYGDPVKSVSLWIFTGLCIYMMIKNIT